MTFYKPGSEERYRRTAMSEGIEARTSNPSNFHSLSAVQVRLSMMKSREYE